MKAHHIGLAAAILALVASPATARAAVDAQTCRALAHLSLPGVEILEARTQDAGPLPLDGNSVLTGASAGHTTFGPHCLIEGRIGHRAGVGGTYGIGFQLRAPLQWNGKFLFQGGGGMDGFIAPAVGSVPLQGSDAVPALARGYAVVSMDGGHTGRDASFAFDQQARLDLAYAAIGKVADTAKRLIQAHYGRPPVRTVFMGCSNGGREAMIAAQRYPTDFDGIVAGNPGFRLSRASVAQAWDVRRLMEIAPEEDGSKRLSKALTREDLDLVSSAVLQACDGLDGNEDGIVNAYKRCRFTLKSLRGRMADRKLDALEAVMAGPVDSAGRALYSDWPVDAGINAPGWRMWKLGTSDIPQSNALNVLVGSDSLPRLFMTPPRRSFDVTSVDFDHVVDQVAQMGALNDATSTYLSTFSARGGKMLVFQGLSDPVFSANDIARWYEAARADTGGDFARLFMVPGMTHCGGGPSLDNFDALGALESWMETGNAPSHIASTGKAFPGMTQPLCPYPQEANFEGGDRLKLSSYVCR